MGAPDDHVDSTLLRLIRWIGWARVGTGFAAVVVPTTAARVFGFPADDLRPGARVLTRMFGSREIVLGTVTALGPMHDDSVRSRVLQLNLLVDSVDALAATRGAAQNTTLRRAGWMIVPAAVASVLGHGAALVARRRTARG